MKKQSVLYLFVLASLILVSAACGATATPTLAPVPTKAQATATSAPAAPQATATKAPTVAAPTATLPPPTATTVVLPTATSAPVKAPTAQPAAPADARDSILKAMQAQLSGKSYRVRQTSESASGQFTNLMEFVPPDRYRITSVVGATTTEMMIIGKKAYRKQGGQWAEFPFDIGSMIQSLTSAATDEAVKGLSDVKLVGTEALDGVPTLVYTYNSKAKFGDIETTSAVKLWVGVADGLPRKQVVEGEAMGVKSTTTQLIEYDPTIKIEPPM